MNMERIILLLTLTMCLGIMSIGTVQATHNRAGEITYEQIGPLTIRMTITTYTKTSSQSADRDSLEVYWGDGTNEFVKRSNGEGEALENDVKVNYYIKEHTYPGRGTYTIGFTDPNRVANILNVNWPNSVEVPFYLSTTFTFLDAQFQGSNNSAILLQAPIDIACAGKRFTHNPNAYDVDGDSLSYELVTPLEGPGDPVPGYEFPDQISPAPDNIISINPRTGDIVWDVPKIQGEYNIAIKINEWRNGVLLNSIIRDMQILVIACDNDPPTIETEEELCVIAGERISLDILIDDPNITQEVKLTYTGGPFSVEKEKAIVLQADEYKSVPFTARFIWQTTCDHISKEYYQVVLKAEDNGFSETRGLATLKTIRIKVVGPPPLDLQAESLNESIKLSWESPYDCEDTDDEFFRGFSVWRKVGSSTYDPDTCQAGLSNSPFEKIIFKVNEVENGRYISIDDEVEKGVTYCYRVQAEFAKLSDAGNPFNRTESLPSEEVCQQLKRDLPLITKVSIRETGNDGSVDVHFTRSVPAELDTIKNPPPYRYELYRSLDEGANYSLVNDFTRMTSTFFGALDTTFIDVDIATDAISPRYYISFYSNGNLVGNSSSSSSEFLTVSPSDNKNRLLWNATVPWSNVRYEIYRQEDSGDYTLLASTQERSYIDDNLVNGVSYCYYIKSYDTYGLTGIQDPLENLSQMSCGAPFDNVAPCAPVMAVNNICNVKDDFPPFEEDENQLSFGEFISDCSETGDVAYYNIYFSENAGGEKALIGTSTNGLFIHNPENGLYGCYAVTAVDQSENESPLSMEVCSDSCPLYELPNTFTPNNDGSNDIFKPIENRFIAQVDFNVFNEWGVKVYETNDPNIDWGGQDQSGNALPDGTYYYTCRIFETRADGLLEGNQVLTGYIHLIK